MKAAALGAGAIGAYVGAALHRAGADVHLVARGPHLSAMRRDGGGTISVVGVASTPGSPSRTTLR